MTDKFYYHVRLGLSSSSFKDYELLNKLPFAFEAEITSKPFSEYKNCTDACNLFMNDLCRDLTKNTKEKHSLSWESNPKFGAVDSSNNIALSSTEWKDHELIKIYVINPKKAKKDDNVILTAAMATILMKSEKQSITGSVKILH